MKHLLMKKKPNQELFKFFALAQPLNLQNLKTLNPKP